MSVTYCVDPGTLQSALVTVRRGGPFGYEVLDARMFLNGVLLAELARAPEGATFVCERLQAMGMPIGNETIETIFWSGRFYEAWPAAHTRFLVTRGQVKIHLCGTMRAKDANVRAVLMDRFGGSNAKGTKAKRGPLYGLSGHHFAALAVGITWLDQHPRVVPEPSSPDIRPLLTTTPTETVRFDRY